MAAGQDSLVAVNDLVNGTIIEMPPSDAVIVTTRYPARFTFSDPDPRIVVATLASFFENSPQTPTPVVTGSKAGAPANLVSLIAALEDLGLIVDGTS